MRSLAADKLFFPLVSSAKKIVSPVDFYIMDKNNPDYWNLTKGFPIEREVIMRIDILCKPESSRRCEKTLENVREALLEMGVEAEVHMFRDRRKMIDCRVYVSPAVLIDDQVRVAGRIPEVREIKSLLAERPRYLNRMTA
jgi:hypothetical protein